MAGSAPRLDFGALLQHGKLRPSRASYVATTQFFSKNKTTARLHGSMSGAGRIWLNGKAVGADLVAAGLTGDEWSFPVELRAGQNSLQMQSVQWRERDVKEVAWTAWAGLAAA